MMNKKNSLTFQKEDNKIIPIKRGDSASKVIETYLYHCDLPWIINELISCTRSKAEKSAMRGDWETHYVHAINLVSLLSIQNKVK